MFLVSLSAMAGSWEVLLLKDGTGKGKTCFPEESASSCGEDESGSATSFVLDDEVKILAQPDQGSAFKEWRGDCESRSPQCKLAIKKKPNRKPLEATAVFEKVAPPSLSGTDFCFLLYDMKADKFVKEIGGDRCKERFPACSTFKVPLAVMAFDAGILKDENVMLKWDGRKESREAVNRDHNAKTWMRDSVVWFSQRLTPLMGAKKFQKYLDGFDYGNRDFSQGITTAWLVSPSEKKKGLRASAYDQIAFMKKLWRDQLPATARAMKLTREITFLEASPNGFKMSGKTGSGLYDKAGTRHLGWFISHIEKDGREYLAVVNFSDLESGKKGYGGPRAKAATKELLTAEGLWAEGN